MIPLDALVVAMVGDLAVAAGDDHLGLTVDGLEVSLPIESRITSDGRLLATPPRGSLRTGFDAPHGELSLGFVARSP